MHLHDRDILFACIGKLYVAKWDDVMNEANSHVTMQEMKSMYMKAEVKRAKQAYQLASVNGYPLVSELINLVEGGNISGIPGITHVDIKRAYEIYGESVAFKCGKMTKRKISRLQFSEDLKAIDKEQGQLMI